MDKKKVNWVGLASSTLLVAVIVLSLFNPWWQLKIGDFVYANFSPLNNGFNFLGITFLVPLLTAVNISSLLLLSISTVLMIIYSANPTKVYSKQLLCWSYKQPLFTMMAFVAAIVALTLGVSYLAAQYVHIDFSLPIMGSTIIQLPSEMLGQVNGVEIGMTVTTGFHWTFYLAIAATTLCVVTRYYHGRITPNIAQIPNSNSEAQMQVPVTPVLNNSDSIVEK